jgi:hypothetical protein
VRFQLLAPDEPDGFWRYQERYLSHRVEGTDGRPDRRRRSRRNARTGSSRRWNW